jgi:hypothetical protein
MEDVVDTQESVTESTTNEATQDVTQNADAQHAQNAEEKRFKLKVNGEELDLTEPEVIKYAQLGKAGQRAMEKAAMVEKKQREMYGQLVKAAETDVFALYEVLTGKKHPYASGVAQQNGQQQNAQEMDPRDLKLREYEEKLTRIEQKIEGEEIEKERQAIETELSSAVKKYPELDSPYLKHFVKSEYRKALINGLELSLEDVAFYVAQDVKQQAAAKQKATVQKLEENKKRAPVITPPSGGEAKKPMSLEDVKRLAGRI